MKWFAVLAVVAAAPLAYAGDTVIPENVIIDSAYFSSSSSSLTADGYELLRSVAAAMKAQPGMRLEIEGHADASGRPAMNQKLSVDRAEVVHGYLLHLGIAASRLTAKGYGATRPVNDNSTLELRSYNRRVQFRRIEE